MASLAQAAGVDAFRMISTIVTGARNATMHRENCEKIAEHVRIIGNLLEKLKSSEELKAIPATREALDGLEEALRKALDLVESCRENSYLYMLAMGWSVVYQFRQAQAEIDRYLQLVPLISLVHEYQIQERLQAIEEDHREYTLDSDDEAARNVVMRSARTKEDAKVLEKSLSRRYPDLEFNEALSEEKEKLQVELKRSRVNNDPKQCNVIHHLIDVTENVVNVLPQNNQSHHPHICAQLGTTHHNLVSKSQVKSSWQTDLFDCCMEPCLCLKTCFYPCGVFTSIANVASKGKLSRKHACNDLMAYSIVLGCCCYTCCVRRKLRKLFGIEGGSCDDFLTHLMCCCCALVQEWHEIELRGGYDGYQRNKMNPPPSQDMKA